MKLPVVNRNEYTIYLEFYNNMYWLHTDVFKWTAEVKKDYVRELNQLQILLNAPLYGIVDNPKLGKFGRSLGFAFVNNVVGNDNRVYQIYVRSL